MRSGTETTSRAFLYSGFLEKREEASRVETSSGQWLVHRAWGSEGNMGAPFLACSNSGSDMVQVDCLGIVVRTESQVWTRRGEQAEQ